MNELLLEMQLDINLQIHEIHELTKDIGNLDKIIENDSVEYPEAREHMDDVIEAYKKAVDKARILLEAYFFEEARLGEPTDFLYRKLYSKLKQAY